MSTRSAITRPVDNGLEGVYHHWDGYPSGLGWTLIELRNKTFEGDTDLMVKTLITDHPAGWSTLNRPGHPQENGPHDMAALAAAGFGNDTVEAPECYCHGERSEGANPIHCLGEFCTGKECDPLFIEWLYVIRPEGLEVFASRKEGTHYVHRSTGVLSWASTFSEVVQLEVHANEQVRSA